MKKGLNMLLASILGSGITIGVFLLSGLNKNDVSYIHSSQDPMPVQKTNYMVKENGASVPLDFTGVSKKVMNGVVHIKSVQKLQVENPFSYNNRNPFEELFGDQLYRHFYGSPNRQNQGRQKPQEFEQAATGSGVIIGDNGYIVTNNHVVEGADEIEVILHNNETYKAKVVGTDPSTDLALLQIKAKDLPVLTIGNSDNVEVGEWVVAVGNPFNLNSTVTAGIVSAKGRNINIIDDNSAIEAFIQTDAAINPGNSGGALVNLNGELIGINTAIASPTGSYAGYGFAIPANIVSKVVEDIMKYGMVQRAYLGIMIRDIDNNLKEENKLKTGEGAYVDSLTENSAAKEAGIKEGDVITGIDDTPILKTADLLETIGRHRPGDQVSVMVDRNGKKQSFNVQLANQKGMKNLSSAEEQDIIDALGATLEPVNKKEAQQLGIDGGVRIKELHSGILKTQTQIKEGFIIIGIDNQQVTSVEDLRKVIKNKKGGVMLEGIYENYPGEIFYAFGLPD